MGSFELHSNYLHVLLVEAAAFSLRRSLRLTGTEPVEGLLVDAAFSKVMTCCSVNALTFLAGFWPIFLFLGTLLGRA